MYKFLWILETYCSRHGDSIRTKQSDTIHPDWQREVVTFNKVKTKVK